MAQRGTACTDGAPPSRVEQWGNKRKLALAIVLLGHPLDAGQPFSGHVCARRPEHGTYRPVFRYWKVPRAVAPSHVGSLETFSACCCLLLYSM